MATTTYFASVSSLAAYFGINQRTAASAASLGLFQTNSSRTQAELASFTKWANKVPVTRTQHTLADVFEKYYGKFAKRIAEERNRNRSKHGANIEYR